MTVIDSETETSFDHLVRARHSVRGFLDKPVPQQTLNAVFELAQWAPSNCNIQPWLVYVASGKMRDQLRQQFMDNIQNGVPPNHWELI